MIIHAQREENKRKQSCYVLHSHTEHPELCFAAGASTVTLSISDAAAVLVHTFKVALPVAVLLTKSCVMALVEACRMKKASVTTEKKNASEYEPTAVSIQENVSDNPLLVA
jgi:hypothetical protein